MHRRIRPICGALALFFAFALYICSDEEVLAAASLGVIAIFLLYREVIVFVTFSVWTLRAFGRLLQKRAKKVERERHCACCGALPVYMITTCATADCAEPIPEVQIFLVCQEHHPNPEIGTKARELHAYIRKIHPGITIERIYLHNPYQ